jgi:hypothetical protein
MPYFNGIQGSTVPYFMLKLWNIFEKSTLTEGTGAYKPIFVLF